MAKFKSKKVEHSGRTVTKSNLGPKKNIIGKKKCITSLKSTFNNSKKKNKQNAIANIKFKENQAKKSPIDQNANKQDKKRKSSFDPKETFNDVKKGKVDTKVDIGSLHQEVIKDLMLIYEQLRKKKTSKEDKHKLIEKVLNLTVDKKNQVVFKHDTVRVLEHCVKFGDVKQRERLFDLFKDNTIDLVTTEGYSKFLVKKFMEYGTKEQKSKIITSFYGKVTKLIKQKTAADVLEEIFAKYANASQRSILTQEFYGPEFDVYKAATGMSFEHMMENEPTKKRVVLDYMKSQFVTLCQKHLILHGISHKALLAFFNYASDAQKLEVHEVLKEQLLQILHTKEGAKVAIKCLWMGTKKDRKNIVKSFKTFFVKISKEEFGHLVMLALFDVIDDTVLVNKALFPELLSNIHDIAADQYGRKVILYLLKPRSPSYFLPDIIKLLEQGDNNLVSKKVADVRQSELRAFILPGLLKAMSLHITEVLKNKSAAIVFLAMLDCTNDDTPEIKEIFEKTAKIISEPIQCKESTDSLNHPICDACGHWVIKSMVQQDKKRVCDDKNIIFSQILCETMPSSNFVEWSKFNRGAFVLVSLMETGIETVKKHISNIKLPDRKSVV